MCGLTAWFAYRHGGRSCDLDSLASVSDSMRSRGPDGNGLWRSDDATIGLAHRRLAIIDLSETGAQPMASDDGFLRVVFNGEIYNYRQLRRQLEANGCIFRSTSDTEVLLHLYAQKGLEMFSYLRGMYAFAIWDENYKRLVLARDAFGIKPLYYADDGKTIIAASQVKALRLLDSVDDSPDCAGQFGFMLWGYVPEPYTTCRGIRALEPGCFLVVEQHNRPSIHRFFSISEEIADLEYSSSKSGIPVGAIHEEVRAALADSIRRHMISDVPVGVFLSAGLDSNTITGLASELQGPTLRTITLGFEEFRGSISDETGLAALASEHWRTEHSTRWITRREFETDLELALRAMDQPSIDGLNTYFVSKAAAESGLKVALSGLGGDELFAGYDTFRDVPRIARLCRLFPAPRVGATLRKLVAPAVRHFTSPKYAGLLEYGGCYGGAYLLRRALFMPWELATVLDADLVKEGWRELDPIARLEDTIANIRTDRLKVSALEMNWYMRNQLLRDSDWAGMAHSLEIRVPLVDLDLMRTIAGLAVHLHGKEEMTGTLGKPIPESLLRRPKSGFSFPIKEWTSGTNKGVLGRGLRSWALTLSRAFGMSPTLSGSTISA
jgi:asparagine synthase (glutamine-hydrolysing)